MTDIDIKINAYAPGDGDAEFAITMNGIAYGVHWDHDKSSRTTILLDGEEIEPSDEERDAVLARIELFLTFFNVAALRARFDELTRDALQEMDEHLAHDAVFAEGTVVTVARSYNLRIHQTYDLTLKAGEALPDDLGDPDFDERVCEHGILLNEEVELLDNDELNLDVLGTRPESAPSWSV